MILIGFGGNLAWNSGPPPETFRSAVRVLASSGVRVLTESSVYVSPPWPSGNGPEYFNLAVSVDTNLAPGPLLQVLLRVEAAHGRTRRQAWGPRTLDLDILDYRGLVTDVEFLALPHPWVEARAFVLKPVAEIAPNWRHPLSGLSAREALLALDPAERDACSAFIPS